MKILMVLTPHYQVGEIGRTTSFWLNEFATSYYIFKDEGADITVVWSADSSPTLGPISDSPELQSDALRRFKLDASAQQVLAQAGRLASVSTSNFDVVSCLSAHAQMRNQADEAVSTKLIEFKAYAGKTANADCHWTGLVRLAKVADVSPLLERKRIFGSTSSVKASVNFSDIEPFLVDNMPVKNGGVYSKGAGWKPYA